MYHEHFLVGGQEEFGGGLGVVAEVGDGDAVVLDEVSVSDQHVEGTVGGLVEQLGTDALLLHLRLLEEEEAVVGAHHLTLLEGHLVQDFS